MWSLDLQTINLILLGMSVVLGLYWGWRRLRRRRDAGPMRDVAARLGMRFEPEADVHPNDRFTYLPLFSRGNEASLRNVMRTDDLVLFQLVYDVGRTAVRREIVETGLALADSARMVSYFSIEPRAGVGERAFRALATGVEALIGNPEALLPGRASGPNDDVTAGLPEPLTQRYRVSGEPSDLQEILGAGLADHLVANPGWSVCGSAEWIVVSRPERVAAEDLPRFREQAGHVAALARSAARSAPVGAAGS